MFADPKQTAARKLRRRVKAGVSIVVAVVAGTWLACRPNAQQPGPSPQGPDARTGPERSGGSSPPPPPPNDDRDAANGNTTDGTVDGGTEDSSADASLDVSNDRALAPRRPHNRTPAVDRHEHRNGMPVRDNLLE